LPLDAVASLEGALALSEFAHGTIDARDYLIEDDVVPEMAVLGALEAEFRSVGG
jgi:hypothetical protein